jgi:hypothetical protein
MLRRGGLGEELVELLEVEEHERRRVVDLVRHARRELTEQHEAICVCGTSAQLALVLRLLLDLLREHVQSDGDPVEDVVTAAHRRAARVVLARESDEHVHQLVEAFAGLVHRKLRSHCSASRASVKRRVGTRGRLKPGRSSRSSG